MSTPEPDTVLNERLQHINSMLRAIRTVNRIIVRVADLHKVARYVCQNLVDTRSYRYAWIALLDAAGHPVYATGAGYSGPDPWPAAKSGIKQLSFCAQQALNQPGVAVIKNPVVNCNGCPLAAEAARFSALSIRLAYQDDVYGVMTISAPRRFAYDLEEHRLLLELASDIAHALHNIRLKKQYRQAEAEIRLKNQELGLLNRIISASAASSDLYEILEITCRELALFFEVPQSAAALLNPQKTEAVVRAEYLAEGWPSGLNHVIPAANNPVFDYLLTHKTPLVIDDTRHDPRLAAVRELVQARGTVSMLLVPLMVNNDVVGSLGVDVVTSRTFSEAEVNLAPAIPAGRSMV